MDESIERMSERERMLAGQPYRCDCDELESMRAKARRLTEELNSGARPADAVLREIFARFGEGGRIEPPFRCDYGCHTSIGKNFYANYDCIVLDCAKVHIGDNVMLGPRVTICTATHPICAEERRSALEMALPVEIDDGVWIGAGAIVNPGVSIGARSVIGSGSVVTKDIPADVVAAGNPCRVIRHIEENA